eukprot:798436_1
MNGLDALSRFTPAIVASPSTFVTKFDELGGMNHLIKTISSSTSSATSDLLEAFLTTIKAMLDSPRDVGFEIISKHSHIITAIVNMFDAVQMSIKIYCVRILLMLCWWRLNQIWPLHAHQ